MDETFEAYFDHASALMKRARKKAVLREAAWEFEHASTLGDKWEHLRGLHMTLVCRRMAGDYIEARSYFGVIKQQLQGDSSVRARGFLARVQRDAAMSWIAQITDHSVYTELPRLVDAAKALLNESMSTLDSLGEFEEANVTRGFEARLEMSVGRYWVAAALAKGVDAILQTGYHPVYELNHLVFRLSCVVPIAHPRLIGRALRLTRQTGDTRRYVQIALLVITGGRLRRARY